jgi:hypothetical protein
MVFFIGILMGIRLHNYYISIFYITSLLFIAAYWWIFNFFILPVFTDSTDENERLYMVFVLQPVASFLCRVIFDIIIQKLASIQEISHPYMMMMMVEFVIQMFGRMFIANLNSLTSQLVVVTVGVFLNIVVRTSRHLITYIVTYIRTWNRELARASAEKTRCSNLEAHFVYLRMTCSIYSVLFSGLFSFLCHLYYTIGNDMRPEISIGSILIQLFGVLITDLIYVSIAQTYLERHLIDNWSDHQMTHLKCFAPIAISLTILSMKQYVQIANALQ